LRHLAFISKRTSQTPIYEERNPCSTHYHKEASQHTEHTYVKRQATLRGSKTRMKSPAAKHTASYISKILRIIVEE